MTGDLPRPAARDPTPLDGDALHASTPHMFARFPTALGLTLPLALAACSPSTPLTTIPVTVAGKTFQCRISADDDTREKGLGGVASLSADEGMIFAFPGAAPHNFWMRGCIMDLDIAFIDPLGFVTVVHTMAKEELQRDGESEEDYLARLKRFPSLLPAQFALEVAPGTLGPLGVTRGTRVEFDRDALKKLAR